MSILLCGTLNNTSCYLPFIKYLWSVLFPLRTEEKRAHSVGGLAAGSHPIPFRTRQLSPLAAMVLTVTGGESS